MCFKDICLNGLDLQSPEEGEECKAMHWFSFQIQI